MADQDEVAALRAELQTLRDEVASLHAELRLARQHVDLTMRGQLRCRACGGRKIAHAPTVLDRGESDQRHAMALYQPRWWSGRTTGQLEAYTCMACGLVEWWVTDPGALEPHDKYLHIHDGEAAGARDPYR